MNGDGLVVERIEALLASPAGGAAAPSLEWLEATLTEGYAEALALEAERSRVTGELVTLANRLTVAGAELDRLRALLDRLQQRTRALRHAS